MQPAGRLTAGQRSSTHEYEMQKILVPGKKYLKTGIHKVYGKKPLLITIYSRYLRVLLTRDR